MLAEVKAEIKGRPLEPRRRLTTDRRTRFFEWIVAAAADATVIVAGQALVAAQAQIVVSPPACADHECKKRCVVVRSSTRS